MIRNFEISKQTQDKVKLAKLFIECKYRAILQKEQQNKICWQKIMKALQEAPIKESQKSIIVQKANARNASQIRQQRLKDNLQNYQLLKLIGKGAFGVVRLAKIKQTGQIVAIKKIQKEKLINRKQVTSVYLEKECFVNTHSKWLVQLKSTFQDQKNLYIAMEWVPGGDLLRLLIEKDIFTQTQTKFYIAQLILAIEDMHKSNFIHRDIKPDNILIDKSGHIKLTDFGLSKHQELDCEKKMLVTKDINQIHGNKKLMGNRERHFSKVGTPDYIAPEILTENNYDHKVDIWSAGVIMFECLFGYPPFCDDSSQIVCSKVANWENHLVFPDEPYVSYQAKLLIVGMLNHPNRRLNLKQIKNHQFFQGFDWNNVRKMKPPFTPLLNNSIDTQNFDDFQEQDLWKNDQANQPQQRYHRANNFAGFDWQPEPHNDTLNQTLKHIQSMSQKKLTSNQTKRLYTENQSQTITKKSNEKTRGTNNFKKYEKIQASKPLEASKRYQIKYRI